MRVLVTLTCLCFTQFFAPSKLAYASEDQPTTASKLPPQSRRVGLQGIGLLGLSWQSSSESFDALGLADNPAEFGAGAQVINMWRGLFVQVGYSQWKETGERIFIDSRGAKFNLGIPLTVKANYWDIGAGWRFERHHRSGHVARLVPFVGGGMGVAQYTESSPFAQAGDDFDTSEPSYHAFGGAEFGVSRWLGIAGDVRYRSVSGLLGEGGTSEALQQKGFNGTSVSVRVLVGPRGWYRSSKSPSPPVRSDGRSPSTDATVAKPTVTEPARASEGGSAQPAPEPTGNPPGRPTPVRPPSRPVSPLAVGWVNIRTNAPVYIYPDARRTALTVLKPGTRVRVMEEQGDWLRIDFQDPRLGMRTGYVLRANCQW
jgi:hypothetical protein